MGNARPVIPRQTAFIDSAFITVSSATRSDTIDCCAPIIRAERMPFSSVASARCQTRTTPLDTSSAMSSAFSPMPTRVQIRSERLSMRSPMTPPQGDTNNEAIALPELTQPRASAEPVSWYTSQPWDTVFRYIAPSVANR